MPNMTPVGNNTWICTYSSKATHASGAASGSAWVDISIRPDNDSPEEYSKRTPDSGSTTVNPWPTSDGATVLSGTYFTLKTDNSVGNNVKLDVDYPEENGTEHKWTATFAISPVVLEREAEA